MEVTAVRFRLLSNVWLLLLTQVQDRYCALEAGFPHISTNRLQHFEYESINIDCKDFGWMTGGNVMRNVQSKQSMCGEGWGIIKGSICIIKGVYMDDSGEYWCEINGGQRSHMLNIIVTAGSVILESPSLPVREGVAVTLRCKNKTASSNVSSSFYKNGCLIGSVAASEMTIPSVSKLDEGLYKCNTSGGGESGESWLAVREYQREICSYQLPALIYFLIKSITTILWAVGLLVLRKWRSGKNRADWTDGNL